MHRVDRCVVGVIVDVVVPQPRSDRVLKSRSRAVPQWWIEGVYSVVRLLNCHRHRRFAPFFVGEHKVAIERIGGMPDGSRCTREGIGSQVHSASCSQGQPRQCVHLLLDAQETNRSKAVEWYRLVWYVGELGDGDLLGKDHLGGGTLK